MTHIRKKKTIMLYGLLAVIILAAIIGGYIIYGNAQLKKIPSLTSKQALDYTLKNNDDGIITVGIIQDGVVTIHVYGKDGEELPTDAHIYEIGSVTKTITAAMICQAVQNGDIGLDASIDTYLDLPEKGHYPTIKQLLTHTSGYKNNYFETPMISNFFKRRNDFYGIGDSMILNRLGKTDISDETYDFRYSNFGYATLGLILEKLYKTEYTTLINKYIQTTLCMESSHISNGNGDLGNYWDWTPGDTYMSAGAITSDIYDMLNYAELLLKNGIYDGACLETLAVVDANTKNNEMMNIYMDEIAYGWIKDTHNNIIWHNGATGNYNCYIGLDAAEQNAVVVLSNLSPNYRIPATVVGIKILNEIKSPAD